jgi:hypothetical protein
LGQQNFHFGSERSLPRVNSKRDSGMSSEILAMHRNRIDSSRFSDPSISARAIRIYRKSGSKDGDEPVANDVVIVTLFQSRPFAPRDDG